MTKLFANDKDGQSFQTLPVLFSMMLYVFTFPLHGYCEARQLFTKIKIYKHISHYYIILQIFRKGIGEMNVLIRKVYAPMTETGYCF